MENKRRRGIAERSYSQEIIYEDFQPSSDWTHDPNCHVLLIDLPGFMKEEVKVEVDNFGRVTVSGERRMTDNKHRRFQQVFIVPEDSDFDNISGKLDGEVLFIIMPKKENEIKQETEEKLVNTNETKEEKEPENTTNEEKPRKDEDVADIREESQRNGRKEMKEGRRKVTFSKENDWVEEKERLEVLMETVMDKISKNKAVVASVVVALSFGLYLSHRFRSSE